MTASAGGTDPDREAEVPDTTPEELRRAARFVEAVGLDAVAQFSQLAFPLAIGGVKDFPRPAPEDRAAREGIGRLRRRLEDAVAELHALASALETGLAVPAVALLPVRPYLDAYRAAAPEEQPYLVRAPNERVDEDKFTPVDVDGDDEDAV
jgi:hypothetical protein